MKFHTNATFSFDVGEIISCVYMSKLNLSFKNVWWMVPIVKAFYLQNNYQNDSYHKELLRTEDVFFDKLGAIR